MMGQENNQQKLFYYNLRLEEREPQNHILRKIKVLIDFDFIYQEVKDCYGDKGNVSVPPPANISKLKRVINPYYYHLYVTRSTSSSVDSTLRNIEWVWAMTRLGEGRRSEKGVGEHVPPQIAGSYDPVAG